MPTRRRRFTRRPEAHRPPRTQTIEYSQPQTGATTCRLFAQDTLTVVRASSGALNYYLFDENCFVRTPHNKCPLHLLIRVLRSARLLHLVPPRSRRARQRLQRPLRPLPATRMIRVMVLNIVVSPISFWPPTPQVELRRPGRNPFTISDPSAYVLFPRIVIPTPIYPSPQGSTQPTPTYSHCVLIPMLIGTSVG